MKYCNQCKKFPIFEERSQSYCERCFFRRKSAKDKYRTSHRQEVALASRKWKRDNSEKVRQSNKLYRKANPEKTKLWNSKYVPTEESIKHSRSYSREYYKRNKQVIREKGIANRQDTKKYIEGWRSKNRDKCSAYSKKYRTNHPEKVTLSSKGRREKIGQAIGSFTKLEWDALCEKFGNACLWCGEEKKLTVDHIIPLSKGGRNSIDNIQPLCHNCNSRKYTKILDFRSFGSAIMDWT